MFEMLGFLIDAQQQKKQIRSRLCPYDLFVFTFFSDLTDKHIKTSFSIDFKIKE